MKKKNLGEGGDGVKGEPFGVWLEIANGLRQRLGRQQLCTDRPSLSAFLARLTLLEVSW